MQARVCMYAGMDAQRHAFNARLAAHGLRFPRFAEALLRAKHKGPLFPENLSSEILLFPDFLGLAPSDPKAGNKGQGALWNRKAALAL